MLKKGKKKFKKVSIGTAQFGSKYGATNKKKIIFNDIKKIFSSAKKDQILNFDTAQDYGNAENIIGKFSKRTNFKITTKFNKKSFDLEKSIYNLKNVPECVMFHSLEDYIDKKFRSRIIKFCKIYKIKDVGISLYYNDLKYLKKVDKSISTFQIPLNILDQRFLFNQNFINLVKKNKIKLEARSVFLQGFLFKKPSYVFNKFKVSKNFSTIIMKILKKNKISLAELSYSWVYSNKMINKVVVGLNSYNHYLSLKKFKFLNKKDLILIKKSYSHSKNIDQVFGFTNSNI